MTSYSSSFFNLPVVSKIIWANESAGDKSCAYKVWSKNLKKVDGMVELRVNRIMRKYCLIGG
jgi:hypothetical protein